ncbi:MAG: hypothetical protein ACSHX4_07455 [Opitutaceae bacterium]
MGILVVQGQEEGLSGSVAAIDVVQTGGGEALSYIPRAIVREGARTPAAHISPDVVHITEAVVFAFVVVQADGAIAKPTPLK